MLKIAKLPTPADKFQDETSLVPLAIVETVLTEERKVWATMDKEQRDWFLAHCDTRLRYMDANAPSFHSQVRERYERGLDMCYSWVRHWAEAFFDDPQDYIKKHPPYLQGVPRATDET